MLDIKLRILKNNQGIGVWVWSGTKKPKVGAGHKPGALQKKLGKPLGVHGMASRDLGCKGL